MSQLLDKTIDELLPTDRVIIRLGAKTQRNEANGKDIVIDPAKELDVLYAYYENLVGQKDEFDHENNYCPPLGRTVHLIGLASYQTKTSEMGDNVAIAVAVPFATETSRRIARQQAALAEEQRQQAEAEELARLESEVRLNTKARLQAEAEAQKAQLRAELEAELADQIAAAKAVTDKAQAEKTAAEKAKTEAKKAEDAAKKAAEEAAKKTA